MNESRFNGASFECSLRNFEVEDVRRRLLDALSDLDKKVVTAEIERVADEEDFERATVVVKIEPLFFGQSLASGLEYLDYVKRQIENEFPEGCDSYNVSFTGYIA